MATSRAARNPAPTSPNMSRISRRWIRAGFGPAVPAGRNSAENQFQVTPDPRIQHWGDGLRSRINAKPPETTTDYRDYISSRNVPVISHEIGQWCVYPNFDEIPKYTGYLKPKNFEIFRDRAGSQRPGSAGQTVPARVRQIANAVLQGGDRVRVAHARHGRI